MTSGYNTCQKCLRNVGIISLCLPTVHQSVHANVKALATPAANSFCLRGGSVQPITHFHALLRFEECLEIYLHFKINRHNVFKHRKYLGILLSSHCYQCPNKLEAKLWHTNTKQTNKHVSTQSVSPTLSQSKSTWPPRTKLTGKLASTETYDHAMSHCMYKSHVISYTLYRI